MEETNTARLLIATELIAAAVKVLEDANDPDFELEEARCRALTCWIDVHKLIPSDNRKDPLTGIAKEAGAALVAELMQGQQ